MTSMSSMYAIYKQTHPPTGMEFCLYCNFFNKREKSLVVAGVNQLRVFRLTSDLDLPKSDNSTDDATKSSKMKLECMQSYQLFGNIASLQSVPLAGSPRDALLLSFQEAKLSVVEYDPGTHDLKTLSLHYFEDEELKDGHIMVHQLPFVRADPDGRCAVMLIYGTKLVVLPFRKDSPSDDPDLVLDSSSCSKAPVLASYTIYVKDIEERMDSITDMQFLHGYYEPTLLILYEPLKTWAGRVAIRQDTYAMVAISLNLQQKVHPVIWSVGNLPFDCFQVMAVPRPIGGVIIMAVNSLLYLNQSIPPFGVSLNSMTDCATSFPLKVQEAIKITLDCAQATFISHDKLVVSLKGGELYVVTLVVDGMRSVRSFNFDKAASSVLTTCMCMCEEGYIFLGSRLGNSLLLRYSEKVSDKLTDVAVVVPAATPTPAGADELMDEPQNKRKRCDALGDWMASDVALIEDPDELEVYGSQDQASVQITLYTFEVCDTLLNIGPCGNLCMGEPAFQSEEFSVNVDPDIELVTTSGYGKNGALSVLQRNIRPQVVTTFDLPGCVDMWTVVGSLKEDDNIAKAAGTSKQQPEVVVLDGPEPGPDGEEIEIVDDEKKMNDDQEMKDSEIKEGGDVADGEDTSEKGKDKAVELHHAFLILSRSDSSMILQTGQEINELDHSGFSTQATTVFAGNVGDNKYIVQVSPMGVRLLEGVKQLQHIPLDIGSPIVHATVADPYVTITGEEGQFILLTLREADDVGGTARLAVTKPPIVRKSKILTVSTYRDRSGLFTVSPKTDLEVPAMQSSLSSAPSTTSAAAKVKPNSGKSKDPIVGISTLASGHGREVNDEDDELYGSGNLVVVDAGDAAMRSRVDQNSVAETSSLSSDKRTTTTNPASSSSSSRVVDQAAITFWMVVSRENGLLEIYSLPDFNLVYLVKNFPVAPKVLVDSIQVTSSTGPTSSSNDQKAAQTMPTVKELLLVGLGNRGSRPLLLTRIDEEVYIYEAFSFYETQTENHLKLRFRKVTHNMIMREKKLHKSSKRRGDADSPEPQPTAASERAAHFRYFDDVAGYSGVFICGPYPHWLFLTARGELRAHPMGVDGSVTSFAPFHNINCPKGFLYFNKLGDLRISVLPTHLSYDAPWPARKVPLRCTPHFLSYHVESKTYCVVTSIGEPCSRIVKASGDEKEVELLERDDRFIFPNMEKFSVQLFSPVSWEVIPNTRLDLEEWEHVTCLKNVSLSYEGARSGRKGYLAIGTNYNYGEDVNSRGRIVILDVIEVVPEPGQPLTKNRIKTLYMKEQKGPVTALCQVVGYLLSCIGQKIYVWTLKDNDLVGVAFIDTQIYIHSCLSLKNLILVADIYKSISLLRFQDEVRTLSLVGRDVKPLEIYSLDFFVDNHQIAFLVSDVDKNLILYVYRPEARESFGGQRLLRRADIHVGSNINTFFRIRTKISDPSADRESVNIGDNRHVSVFATLDGSLGYLFPIPEKTYRRLLMLQNVLTTHTPHIAGLNPKAYRMHQSRRKYLMNPSKNILDGDLLWKYVNLSITEKVELAKKIGTSYDQVIDDLMEIDRQTAHF